MKARFDVVIRSGTIADGAGGPLFEGDVAMQDGLIAEVGHFPGNAAMEVDAKGLLVTPGFIDIHTHYDGQATWDQRLTPSSWHGVTTAVMGNCGVGFAPVRPADRKLLMDFMEGVEDIPGAVLEEGLAWNWESFGDYLGALEQVDRDMDICAQLPHGPLRLYVMGGRAARLEAATPADIAAMRDIARDAMRLGAIGFSTSRTLNHRSSTGEASPGLRAAEDELLGIALGLKDARHGVFQWISDWDTPDLQTEFAMMCSLAERSNRPFSYSLGQRHATPHVWKELLDRTRKAVDAGLNIRAQVSPRAVGVLLGLQGSLNPFSDYPSYRGIADKSLAERVAIMRTPAFRAQLLSERPADDTSPIARRLRSYEYLFPLGNPPNYQPTRDSSIAHSAAAQNRPPEDVAYDMLLEDGGRNFIFGPIANYADYNLDVCREMIIDKNTLMGLGDGGAHVSIISDSNYTTFLLTHWGRDCVKGRLDLEWLIKRQTWDNAQFFGLLDRGLVRPGMKADLNLIDFDQLASGRPYMAADLPAGGKRLLQKAQGYRMTLVNGTPTYVDGEATGALPGRLVRGARVAGQKTPSSAGRKSPASIAGTT